MSNKKENESINECSTQLTNNNENIMIEFIYYDENNYQREELNNIYNLKDLCNRPGIKWINIFGLSDIDIIETIGFQFGIHFLVLEDIIETNQRPKFEDYNNYLFIILKMIYYDSKNKESKELISENISLIVFKDILITFQEKPGDVFDNVRYKISGSKGRIRKMNIDFLLYSLMDSIIDNYEIVIENFEEELSELENEVLTNPRNSFLNYIYELKSKIIMIRKNIIPMREVFANVLRSESHILSDSFNIYFKDVLDHLLNNIENVKYLNESIVNIFEVYSSIIANKLNNVMKRLTFITTIFMPLTFLTGIGGMSEWSMITGPDNWKYSYPLFIIICIIIGVITFYLLKRLDDKNL